MPGKKIYNTKYYRSRQQDISDEFSLYNTAATWMKVLLFCLIFVSVPLFFVCLQIFFSLGDKYVYSEFVANYILVCIYCLLVPIFIATTGLIMLKPVYTLVCIVYVLVVAGLSFVVSPALMEKVFQLFIDFLNWVAGNNIIGPK